MNALRFGLEAYLAGVADALERELDGEEEDYYASRYAEWCGVIQKEWAEVEE